MLETAFLLVLGAAIVTYAWRAIGVAVAGRIDPTSPVFEWIGCVAYALLAGLIARMILLPIGPLVVTTMPVRLGSALLALAVFFLCRRNILVGSLTGIGALALATWAGL